MATTPTAPSGAQPVSAPRGSPAPNEGVGNRGALVIGFVVGGAALVALAEVAPQAAIGLTALIGLGVVLLHADELKQLSDTFVRATGHQPTN